MSYEHKPGHGALFKNDKKSKDIHPDYKGQLVLPDGTRANIAGWVTQGASGKYLSLKASFLPPLQDAPE